MKQHLAGWGSGLLGVVIFSGSLPATRVAVADFTPVFLTAARAVIAGVLALALLLALRQPRPGRDDLVPLVLVTLGVVIGFPLLTALALRHVTAAHSVVFIGLLPLSTALFAVIRCGERPRPRFWLFALLGGVTVAVCALCQDPLGTLRGDALMLSAILVCGLGYAEGAALARRLGGWQVISWALILSFPIMLPLGFLTLPEDWDRVSCAGWFGLAYVSLFSMLLGFVFWYRGLALGGIAGVGQLQLLQPFLGLGLAGLLLRETIAWPMAAGALVVLFCVLGARKFA